MPVDLSKGDVTAITGDEEVNQNLGIVINNAGKLILGKFFDLSPSEIELQ